MGVFCYKNMENFKFLKNIDITEILNNLNTFTEDDWLRDNFRSLKYKVHSNTNSLDILWDHDSLVNNTVGKKNEYNYNKIDFDNIKNKLLSIYKQKYGDGKIIRAVVARLKPHSIIPEHSDGGKSLLICKRTHLPLQTNENIIFSVGGEKKFLELGELWEIDNSKPHSVENNSNEYRIHLIVDYLKNAVTI